ncbi:MAG: alpha/beta hydrolase [Phenylobacterium zucineum]|nr:MAG: alpha/beta hydrolase [Phenylobacterium zucineum]
MADPTAFHGYRGEQVDIGGRRLRVVRAGLASEAPMIILECGAFGCAADWAVVQDRLAAQGLASLAYDRAGLGYSDPGPAPRDGQAIVSDLETLLHRLEIEGPLLMVGHSMAGLMLRIFVGRNRHRVRGLVLVDAVTSETIENPAAARAIAGFQKVLALVGRYADLGFMRPVSWVIGDKIGLGSDASREKRRIYGLASHARWSADEVAHWSTTSQQGRDLGHHPPDLPVAVVTAGAVPLSQDLRALQSAPARASTKGYLAQVGGAGHANLLGLRFADSIIEGIHHVLKA